MNECKIVQDLLPLYVEDLVSEETKAFVDSHCEGCENCEKLRSRSMEPVPQVAVDPKAYQKMMRRDSIKMITRGVGLVLLLCLAFVLLVGGGTAYVAWENGQFPLEKSYESTVYHEEYGKFTTKIEIADWDKAGFFDTGAGSVITTTKTNRRNDGGSSTSTGRGGRPWENVQLYWAPDGMDYLLVVDIVGGSRDYFLIDREFEELSPGKASFGDTCYPSIWGNGLKEQLLILCEKEADFPTGWKEVTFSFYQWADDSETITFIYETDNGFRGLVDFHYPTETVQVYPANP